MIKNFFMVFFLLQFVVGCASTDAPESTNYPRMPDAYRNDDNGYRKNGNNIGTRNPLGMSIYDAAETEAEEDYFGVEVVSLEESQRILKERKLQKQQEKKE